MFDKIQDSLRTRKSRVAINLETLGQTGSFLPFSLALALGGLAGGLIYFKAEKDNEKLHEKADLEAAAVKSKLPQINFGMNQTTDFEPKKTK